MAVPLITTIITTEAMQTTAQLRLWQLISPALPVGAYAYSQGLETAIEEAWVHDEQSTLNWLTGILQHSLLRVDVPVLSRLYQAWQDGALDTVQAWNARLLAMRESAELREEDRQMGQSLARLLNDLGFERALFNKPACSFLSLFSLAAVTWQIPLRDTASGFLWSWCENQVAAAIKLVPLGQTAGQRILGQMIGFIDNGLEQGLQLKDDEIGSVLPGLAMASAWHESQYSRLFRS